MRNKPTISVVIPAYNEEKYLPQALESLKKQVFKDFELIVVDNASTDKTAAIARSFGARVIKENRQGIGFARQAGFVQTKGQIIATTDADTIVPPDWLRKINQAFENDKELAALGGKYSLYSGPWGTKLAIWFFWNFLSSWVRKLLNLFYPLPFMAGCNLAVRKKYFLACGGFREEIQVFEDTDLARRLSRFGKVKLDLQLRVTTSGRRFRHGLWAGLFPYLTSFWKGLVMGKAKSMNLHPVRNEANFGSRAVSTMLLILLILSGMGLTFHQGQQVEAKIITTANQQFKARWTHLKTGLIKSKQKILQHLPEKRLWQNKYF